MAEVTVELLTLCDHALTSKEGKLSIIGIFDRMFVRGVPTTFSRFFVVAILNGAPESEHQINLSIQDPQGKEVLPTPKDLKIQLGTQGRSNILTDVVNLPIPMVGEYTIAMREGDNRLAEKKLGVVLIAPDGKPGEKLPN